MTPIDIGRRRELFVDDFLIATTDGVCLRLQQPERREAVLVGDAAWEDKTVGFKSVVQDGDSVRLYYRASFPDPANEDLQAIAMAESRDGGITFSRPDLNRVESLGSTQNNILAIQSAPRIPPVFIDTNPDANPDERFKGISESWRSAYAMCSADGLDWRCMQGGPLEMSGTFDTQNTAFWDGISGCYRSFTRFFYNLDESSGEAEVLRPQPTVVRAIQMSTSDDFIHWATPTPLAYDDGIADMQLYTNAIQPCPGAEHIYIGFPNRYVQQRTPYPEHILPGCNDALFMASRDGVRWRRYADAWVRPGLDPLNWTERNNYPVWGIVQTSATEWSKYISEHYRHDSAPCRCRRLSIRPHGFVSAHAGYAGGELITKPLVFAGAELRLNVSTSAAGAVRVELQDAAGAALPGHTLADADELYGDDLDRPVTWRGTGDLSQLAGRPVRLRFALKDADVFAFRTV
jgi:hypothetical protein